MTGGTAILGMEAARRATQSTADNVSQVTMKAAVDAIVCLGMAEVWLALRMTVASATMSLRIAWYDVDGNFLFAEDPRTFTASATIRDGASTSLYLSGAEVYAVPGAYSFRLWITTAASSGTVDIYAGVKP